MVPGSNSERNSVKVKVRSVSTALSLTDLGLATKSLKLSPKIQKFLIEATEHSPTWMIFHESKFIIAFRWIKLNNRKNTREKKIKSQVPSWHLPNQTEYPIENFSIRFWHTELILYAVAWFLFSVCGRENVFVTINFDLLVLQHPF